MNDRTNNNTILRNIALEATVTKPRPSCGEGLADLTLSDIAELDVPVLTKVVDPSDYRLPNRIS